MEDITWTPEEEKEAIEFWNKTYLHEINTWAPIREVILRYRLHKDIEESKEEAWKRVWKESGKDA